MRNDFSRRNNFTRIVIPVLAFVLLSGLLVAARTRLLRGVSASNKTNQLATPPEPTRFQPPAALQSERVPSELVTLRTTGFEPAELSRGTGKFLFGVNNGAGLSDLTFQLSDETGKRIGEKLLRQERVWRQVVNLEPGHYSLTVVNHPEWVCHINIR